MYMNPQKFIVRKEDRVWGDRYDVSRAQLKRAYKLSDILGEEDSFRNFIAGRLDATLAREA
jgi:hypothetical protein